MSLMPARSCFTDINVLEKLISAEQFKQDHDQYHQDLDTLQCRLDTLSIQASSDIQIYVDTHPDDWGRSYGFYLTPPTLSDLLRALNAAKTESRSHRSRADPGLELHRRKTTNAHIQRLLQKFLTEIVDYWANMIIGLRDHLGISMERMEESGYSKDVIARVEEKCKKMIAAPE
jgi:hypothetical protein